jgi:hypothetical protein
MGPNRLETTSEWYAESLRVSSLHCRARRKEQVPFAAAAGVPLDSFLCVACTRTPGRGAPGSAPERKLSIVAARKDNCLLPGL